MKILFLTNKVPYPPKDGGSIATFGMIKAFADAGHKTSVLAMNTRKHHVTPFEIPAEIKAQITMHLVEVPALINPLELINNLLFSKLPYNAQRFIDQNYKNKLKSLLQAFTFDIIQLEGLYLCPYIKTIRANSNAKIVYRSHNIEHEIWERTVQQTKGIKKIYIKHLTRRIKKFELDAINTYDSIIPITKRDLKKLNKLGNLKPSFVIPAGFEIEEIENTSPAENNLFFIGALDWAPNQEGLNWFFKKCWKKILQVQPQINLIVAGRNAPNWFIQKIKEQPNVQYRGEIPDAQEFISTNNIMIAPLLSGSGMRVKIIEGMMYKKAIVTTPVGCEGIDVKNKEQIFIADKPAKFVKHCLTLTQNRKLVVATGNKAFKFVQKHYDNKILNKKLVAFYNKIIE